MMAGALRSWMRLFMVQGSWNFERMIGVGLAHAMEPLLRSLPEGDHDDRQRGALARAASFFNTHPYLAGLAAGAVARAEQEGQSPEQIQRLKAALVGPLGSIGDKLIWAGALPASVGVGLVISTVTVPWLGAVVFLVLFNAVHLPLRWWALAAGLRTGVRVAGSLKSGKIQKALSLAGPVAVFALGLSFPLVAEWLLNEVTVQARLAVLLVVLVTVGARRLARSVSAHRFGILVAIMALVLSWVWPA